MPWTLRLRIRPDVTSGLSIDVPTCTLTDLPQLGNITITSWPGRGTHPISKSEALVFTGQADSESEAWARGALLADRLRRTFSRLGIAAEFGQETVMRVVPALREKWSQEMGMQVLDDVHGLMVFEGDARFVSMKPPILTVTQGRSRFEQVLAAACRSQQPLSPSEQVAYDLLSAYRFEYSPAARLITLTMAVETMLGVVPRSASAAALVERFIEATEADTTLTDPERKSLLGSLEWLREESITTKGVLLMRTRLQGRTYGSESEPAERVWKTAYGLRSKLAHGDTADRNDVNRYAGLLFEVVRELLSGDLLTFEPQ